MQGPHCKLLTVWQWTSAWCVKPRGCIGFAWKIQLNTWFWILDLHLYIHLPFKFEQQIWEGGVKETAGRGEERVLAFSGTHPQASCVNGSVLIPLCQVLVGCMGLSTDLWSYGEDKRAGSLMEASEPPSSSWIKSIYQRNWLFRGTSLF